MSDFCATPQESLTLDVGCGASPKGDVNVDLCPFDRSQCADEWSPKATKNFVLADASHLPFKSGCFGIVYASHVLEHVPNPLSALEEWRRVCCGRVIVWIPILWKRSSLKFM
jgi:ubiquinone/menaquinone biosynthesis C-methylase UbiE